MNLFIFRVETGTMLEFQLEMTAESVEQLKLEISRRLDVSPQDQVLLVSGGICLENSSKVISYSAGTDTSPIFLFNKMSIESNNPPQASACPNSYMVQFGNQKKGDSSSDDLFEDHDSEGVQATGYSSYNEFRKRVLKSKNLPSTMETVTKRARLAQEFYEEAVRESQCCQNIVYDQQLQHQGWLAAIANLEDITNEFQKRISTMRLFFDEYIEQRNSYVDFLSVYKDALDKLGKIPIISSLLLPEGDIDLVERDSLGNVDDGEVYIKPSKTLLEWIEARRDSNSETTMDSLFDTCTRGIDYYHADLFRNLYAEVQNTLITSSNADLKEISGLSKRLFSLDQLSRSCEPLVKEQNYSAQSFQNNQARAGDLRDNSVLPDLCISHGKQLVCMLSTHWKLCDIHRRCMRSKEELCNNLHQRLKWMIHAENLLRISTDRILAYYEHVSRLRFNISVLQQIYVAPEAYMASVVEVLRRKKFSQAFLLWASELACYMLTIYNEEVTRRKEFRSKFEGHFLMGLFPGMNDLPPNFATQAPSIFDSSLPNVSIEDIEELKKAVPEMAENLAIPDMTAITNFFLAKSQVKSEDKAEGTCEEKMVQVVNEVGLGSNLDQNLLKPGETEICLLPHGIAQLKDLDRGCESETDTEEFEKVCQSPMEVQFDKDLPSSRPGFTDMTTLTEVCDKNLTMQQPLAYRKPPRSIFVTSEGFTNIKNTSLESIDELASVRNISEACSFSQQHNLQGGGCGFVRSKSLSPRCDVEHSVASPLQGHQPSDFVNEEFYIDESLPSSLSIDAGCTPAAGEIAQQLSNANEVVALLQDNLQSSRSEQDKLRDLLINMATIYRTIFTDLRHEMTEIKTKVQSEGTALEVRCKSLSSSWDNITYEFDQKEKEIFKLTEIHRDDLSACRLQLKAHNDEIKCLREENSCLDSSLNKLVDENKQLLGSQLMADEDHRKQIIELQLQLREKGEKEREMKETIDRLTCEHKSEMDNLRKKFRFMTGRSPSECQDKPITLGDSASPDLKRRATISEGERKKVIDEYLQSECDKTDKIISEHTKEYEFKLKIIRDDAKRSLDDKDKLIDALTLDSIKQKNLIQQLTESHLESSCTELRNQVEILQKQKGDLESQLSSERLKRMESSDMTISTSSCSGAKRSKYRDPLTVSQTSLVNLNRVNVDTCSKGDRVLIMWKSKYKNFVVLQESDMLHFVHSDCTGEYQQLVSNDTSVYFTAQVLEKEYCQTKKSENRYKLPKGTKFYRVKVLPVSSDFEEGRSAVLMSQSHNVPRSTPLVPMEDLVSDSACHSLPNTPTKESK